MPRVYFKVRRNVLLSEMLTLSSKEILRNPFLVGDFIFEEEKRERLNDCDLEKLEDFFIYFQTEKNLNKIVKLFKEGHYERYYDFRHGEGAFREVIKFKIEPVTPAFLITRAVVNFFYGNESLKYEVEEFASEMASAYHHANKDDEDFKEDIKRNIKGHLKRLGY